MKTLKDFQFAGKKVLLRANLNVPLDERGQLTDDFRLKQALPTIKTLVAKKAKVILISHFSEGKEKSFQVLLPHLKKLLKLEIKFLDDCIGQRVEKEVSQMKSGDVVLLENLRIHPGEEKNDLVFAKKLARLGDIYIDDDFSTTHRKHASIVSLPKFLPSGAGLQLEKEIKILSQVMLNPWRPLVVVMGGVKIEAKMAAFENLLNKADELLLGGELANAFLVANEICIGRPLPESKLLEKIKKMKLTDPKLHLPVDVVVSADKEGKTYIRQAGPGAVRKNEFIFDIGTETINIFSEIIKAARMIIWSGPVGFFENPLFAKGTESIGEAISRNHRAFKVAGGGDTVAALRKFNLLEKFDFVSTGGSAMLRFLGGEKLPGVEVLEKVD